MEALAPVWQRAAEFGVTAFLLVVVLIGCGYGLWKVGNRLVDATSETLRRQAEAADKTANAVEKIGDLAAAIHVQNERAAEAFQRHDQALHSVHSHVIRQHRVLSSVISAVHELTPEQAQRVKGYLDEARRALDIS